MLLARKQPFMFTSRQSGLIFIPFLLLMLVLVQEIMYSIPMLRPMEKYTSGLRPTPKPVPNRATMSLWFCWLHPKNKALYP